MNEELTNEERNEGQDSDNHELTNSNNEPSFDEMQEKAEHFFEFIGDIFGNSIEKAFKTVNSKNKLENVAIFVDYDNVYWTLVNNYSHDPDDEDPNKNLFLRLWSRYGQDHVRTFRAYADFQQVRTSLTRLQKKRIQIRHVYSNDKEGHSRKNSSDIEMCIDVIENTYKDPNVTTYVIVTADSDMIPILSRLRYKGKRVELFYLSKAAPKHIDMTSFADYSEDLLKFINVEVKEFDVEQYILPSLQFINEWLSKYENKTNVFLGTPWLRDRLVEKFGIPSNVSSDIIEQLRLNELIFDKNKSFNGTIKLSIYITEKGYRFLSEATKEVAASSEGNFEQQNTSSD